MGMRCSLKTNFIKGVSLVKIPPNDEDHPNRLTTVNSMAPPCILCCLGPLEAR